MVNGRSIRKLVLVRLALAMHSVASPHVLSIEQKREIQFHKMPLFALKFWVVAILYAAQSFSFERCHKYG